MAEKTITAMPGEKGGAYPVGVSRRDFLKLVLATIGSLAIYKNRNFFNSQSDTGDYFPEDTNHEALKEKVSAFSQKIQKLDAIVAAANSDPEADTREYLRTRYNLSASDIDKIRRSNTDPKNLSAGSIGIIVEASIQETGATLSGLEGHLSDPFSDNCQDALKFVAANSDRGFWKNVIDSNNLAGAMVKLGSKGKQVLADLGYDLNDPKLQRSLVGEQEEQVMRAISKKGLSVVDDRGRLSSTFIVSSSEGQTIIYKYDTGRKPSEIRRAAFILNRLHNLTNENVNDERLSSLPVDEFIIFQAWAFDYYVEKLQTNPNLTESQFLDQVSNELTSSKTFPPGSFVGRLRKIAANYQKVTGEGKNSAADAVLNPDPEKFSQVISTLSPGTRAMFNEKSVRLGEPKTFQMILTEAASSGTLTRENLLTAINKYSGNLFLERIVDQKARFGDIKAMEARKNPNPRDVMLEILSGKISLTQYTDGFFGGSKRLFSDKDNNIYGLLIQGKVSEPVSSMPEEMVSILSAVEGVHWASGRKFLTTLVGRNVKALSEKVIGKDVPISGASSPEMTVIESIFPSPFDKLSAISQPQDGLYPFRRTDLYGVKYLEKLFDALRDDQPVPEIYNFDYLHSPGSPHDPSLNFINRLCAKLESAVLARDFASHFGKDELIKLMFQYVPMGSAKGLQLFGMEAAANYYFGKSLNKINSGEMAILVGMIQGPTAYAPETYNGSSWVIDPTVTKERALKVAEMCKDVPGINVDKMRAEISGVKFTLEVKKSWNSTLSIDQINDLYKNGALNNPGVNIGAGILVSRADTGIPPIPLTVDLPRYANPEQQKINDWFKDVVNEEPLKLATHEDSNISSTLTKIADVLVSVDPSTWKDDLPLQIEKLANSLLGVSNGFHFISSRLSGGKVGPNRNPYERGSAQYDLFNQLYDFQNTKNYQCGQMALLINALMRLKLNISEPELGAGGVENWINGLGTPQKGKNISEDLDRYVTKDYEVIRLDDELIYKPVNNGADLINVGDVVVSWIDHLGGGEHALTVINKGKDSLGRTFIETLDANFGGTGAFRRQIIWTDNLPSTVFPGNPRHIAVIRPKLVDHGGQTEYTGSTFLDRVFLGNAGRQIVIPGYQQKLQEANGEMTDIMNPGIAISVFSDKGFEKSVDPTHTLGVLPITPGNALKLFVHSFLKIKGVDTSQQVSLCPGEEALDGSKTWVANAATLMMNLDPSATVSLDEALAGSLPGPKRAEHCYLFAS